MQLYVCDTAMCTIYIGSPGEISAYSRISIVYFLRLERKRAELS